jgi:hypothetical protein
LFVSKRDTAKLIVPAGAPVHARGGDPFGGVIDVCPALKQSLFIVGDLAKSLPVKVNAPPSDASAPPSHPSGSRHCPASAPPSALPELAPLELLELPPELPELLPPLLPVELPPLPLLEPLPLLLELELELLLPPASPTSEPPSGVFPELPHIAREKNASEAPALAISRLIFLQTSDDCLNQWVSA